MQFEVGDGMVATGEQEVQEQAFDAEDSEPTKPIATPDLPPRSVIEEHRIGLPGHGAMSVTKATVARGAMAEFRIRTA